MKENIILILVLLALGVQYIFTSNLQRIEREMKQEYSYIAKVWNKVNDQNIDFMNAVDNKLNINAFDLVAKPVKRDL